MALSVCASDRGGAVAGSAILAPSRVAWSNNYRLLESIGYIPLAGAEANYCRQLTDNTVDAI